MPQEDFVALSPQICLDLLPLLHPQVSLAARHPLCQLSRGGHLSELSHSLMKSAFCTAKDKQKLLTSPPGALVTSEVKPKPHVKSYMRCSCLPLQVTT